MGARIWLSVSAASGIWLVRCEVFGLLRRSLLRGYLVAVRWASWIEGRARALRCLAHAILHLPLRRFW